MALPVFGLTGGIASGKSTVSSTFERLGVPIIDADELAREIVEPGTEGLRKIVETFGADVLLADGTLDRKALGARVFSDAGLRQKLNAITHPLIARAAAQRMQTLLGSGAPYVLYEAALIVENQQHRTMHGLIVVHVTPETQLARLMTRDGSSESEARARIASQLPLAQKLALADYVIHNEGPLHATEARTREVHDALLDKVGRR